MNINAAFIIESTDFKKLSTKMLKVLVKNLFKFGKKDVKIVENQVHLYLTYHPKNETLDEKLGMLPVRWMRITADDEEEMKLFFQALHTFKDVKRYLLEKAEDKEIPDDPTKKCKMIKPIEIDDDDETNDGEQQQKSKKIKILENRIIKPATKKVPKASTSTANYIENFDLDDEFESQIVKIDD